MASDKYTEHLAANDGKPDISGILRIREKLKEILKPDRYEHSISVSFTSICLAMRYGEDLHRAELAGLVHDCAKQFKHDELIRRCREDGITLTEDMLKAPQVIHSVYGAVYARKLFGIEDPEILSAVYYHTLGRAEMTMLEKIVFTADYIEVRRCKAARLPEIRQLAFTDLDRCIYEIMKDTMQYLKQSGSYICRDSLDAFQYYKNLQDKQHQEAKHDN
ncbi:bis(5'-nucleosyl)-tetraphosphatase (symmetrical) YqeK [Oribacterium sp. HCP28S3_H8]|jgi:predicted HD superfamily hydrolase involved in NAD metabolism|uniref:bis(5'-nucleosyl)-tetraphosphatase (symmetrical) YqeK n=1 Tax=Oribacterium sp. HCP28S3_H8 TaxID=3438945 RepID=UPI003F8AB58B